jgi:hypothetical protein
VSPTTRTVPGTKKADVVSLASGFTGCRSNGACERTVGEFPAGRTKSWDGELGQVNGLEVAYCDAGKNAKVGAITGLSLQFGKRSHF